jgi:hypothetical protein
MLLDSDAASDARAPGAGDRIYDHGPASSPRSCCAAGAARCQPRRWWRAKSLVRPPTHAASPCRSSSPAWAPVRVPVGDLQGWGVRGGASQGHQVLGDATGGTAHGLEPELLGPLVPAPPEARRRCPSHDQLRVLGPPCAGGSCWS